LLPSLQVFDELQLKRINLLAIDVAGAELSVLNSIDYAKVRVVRATAFTPCASRDMHVA
jgi:hypothetical protein